MSQSGFDTISELQQRLEAEISRRQELEVLVTEKESEVECAVAWAQTASETVTALEEQLDEVEAELDKALYRLKQYENGENPWRTKEDAYKHVLLQLTESQNREVEMFQQAEERQRTLNTVQGKLADLTELCATYESEIARLKKELSDRDRNVSDLMNECSQTAEAWESYSKHKGEMDRSLTQHLASATANGEGNRHQVIETYHLKDQIQELEQALAMADMHLLEERNSKAKLQEENEKMHRYVLNLQNQLHQGQSAE